MSSLRSAKLNTAYQSLNKPHQKLFTIIYDYIYQEIYKEVKEKNTLQGFSSTFSYTKLLDYAKEKGFSENVFEAVCKTLEQQNLISYSKTKDLIKIWDGFIQAGGGRSDATARYKVWVPGDWLTRDGGRWYKARNDFGGIEEFKPDGNVGIPRTEVTAISYIGGTRINNATNFTDGGYVDLRFRRWPTANQLQIDGVNRGFPDGYGWSFDRMVSDRPSLPSSSRNYPKPSQTNGCATQYNTDIESYINDPTGNDVAKCFISIDKNSPLVKSGTTYKMTTSVEVATIAPKTTAATYTTPVTTITQITSAVPPPPPPAATDIILVCPPSSSPTTKKMISLNRTKCAQCPIQSTGAELNPDQRTATCTQTGLLLIYTDRSAPVFDKVSA